MSYNHIIWNEKDMITLWMLLDTVYWVEKGSGRQFGAWEHRIRGEGGFGGSGVSFQMPVMWGKEDV